MNTVKSPCETSPDYVYQHCLEDRIAQKMGCKPFWLKQDMNLDTCQEPKHMKDYLSELRESLGMDEQTIYEEFKCLKPCTYIEYKVSFRNCILSSSVSFQFATEPLYFSKPGLNHTVVSLRCKFLKSSLINN